MVISRKFITIFTRARHWSQAGTKVQWRVYVLRSFHCDHWFTAQYEEKILYERLSVAPRPNACEGWKNQTPQAGSGSQHKTPRHFSMVSSWPV